MTSEWWQQIDELFHSALQRDADDRAAFLAQACNGDEPLRQEVESLIESHEHSESFFELPATDVAAELLTSREAHLTPGRTVSHYQIVSLLGKGGMGEVYLARDTRLGRQVALKRLPAQFTLDLERVHRFEQEARAASALNHPNIVTIHEIGRSDATHFITTEFIDGETLRQHMTCGGMKLDEALDIAAQVAAALVAAHDAGIAHRDIKPENIMVRRDGIVKLLDFGLAKLALKTVDAEPSGKPLITTNPGTVMGTVQYMSPEQTRGEEVDTRTDIWSLGVVLYEMVTGRVPFQGETPSHVIVSILENEPAPLKRCSDVAAELERVVSKALRKGKTERYQNAGDLSADLKNLKKEMDVQARLRQTSEPDAFLVAPSNGWFRGAKTAPPKSSSPSTQLSDLTSSAEHLIGQTKQHRRGALLVAAAIFVGLTSVAYSLYRARGPVASSEKKISSIAVLPFVNTSNDSNIEYLAEGLSESLINSLSELPGLTVSARTSSFKYNGGEVDLGDVAHALGVEAILTGHVLRRGDDLLVSVELTDARDATHVWGKRYNRQESDLLAVQVDISREIAKALRLTKVDQHQQFGRRETVKPEAYELLLLGRFYRNKGTTQDMKKAIEYFNQAVAADPTYALAYAELFVTYNGLINDNVLDPKEFTVKAETAAHKALELGDGIAEAHLAMARVSSNTWQWEAAEHEIQRAIELNPNLAVAHTEYTFFLIIHGRYQQAFAEATRARELDPLSPGANRWHIYGLLVTRQNDRALEAARRMLELDRNNPRVYTLLGQIYTQRDQRPEAVAAYQKAIKLGDDSLDTQVFLGAAYANADKPAEARGILKQLEKGKDYVSPVPMAMLHVALGEPEHAIALLERAYAAHDQQLIWLGVEGGFDPLRTDPRFADLMRRVGFRT